MCFTYLLIYTAVPAVAYFEDYHKHSQTEANLIQLEFCKRSCFSTFQTLDTKFLTMINTQYLSSDGLPICKNTWEVFHFGASYFLKEDTHGEMTSLTKNTKTHAISKEL